MSDGWHGESLLGLVAADIGVDEAAQQLLAGGADVDELTAIEEFLHALDADPSARDRALLLVERTRLLAERGATGARRSDQLRADASQVRTGAVDFAFEDVSGVLRHELTTPITVARSALELLAADRNDPATAEEMVGMALRSLRFAGRLLETWGRAEHLRTGRAELAWGQVDLVGLVRECVADVGAVLLGRHEIGVSVDGAVEAPADADAVRQILFNLLTNAAKFSPDGARIEVTVAATDRHAEVAVLDRGPGISPQDAARIFEAGQRAHPGAPGTGLGLFVARQLARAHSGDLHLEDPAGGSRFVLRLPLSTAAWQASLGRREEGATARASDQRERDAIANARDAALDRREEVAAERDAALGSREALADEREAGLDRRDEA